MPRDAVVHGFIDDVESAPIQSWTTVSRRIPGWLPTAILLVVLAFQLAYWTWTFLAPKAPPPPPAPPAPAIALDVAPIVNASLFGAGPAAAATAAPGIPLQLHGVYASRGRAYAIIAVNGTEKSVPAGAEIMSGIELVAVHPRYVTIRRNGQLERLNFESGEGAGSFTPGAGPSPGYGEAPTTYGAPPTGPHPPMTLPRAMFENALRDPGQLISAGRLAVYPGGGIQIVGISPGGLYEKLGLQPGDVVQRINGQPVSNPAQALSLYKSAMASGRVQVTILRAGTVQQLTYTLQ